VVHVVEGHIVVVEGVDQIGVGVGVGENTDDDVGG